MIYGQYRGQLLGALVLTAAAAAPAFAQTAAPTPTFTKDVAPIFQAKCESCHRPDSIAPMSLVTYEQSRPWARSIRDRVQTRQMPPVAPRQEPGHPALRERPLAQRRRDRHHRQVGGGGRAEGRHEGHAEAGRVAERRHLELREAVRQARPGPHVAGLHPEGRRDGRVVQARAGHRPHRGALGARHRDAARHGEGPQDHPPRAGPPAAGRRRRRLVDRTRRRRARSRPVHGMGGRQAGRDHARELGQADEARLEDRVGHPLPRRG